MRELFGIFGRKKDTAAPMADVADDIQPSAAPVQVSSAEVGPLGTAGKDILSQIVVKMGFAADVRVQEKEGAYFYELHGDDMGRLIGKEGNTINALQQLIGSILSKKQQGRVFVKVDANNYRSRREQTLRRMARDAAQMALRQQKPVELEPMSAAERRFIHDELSSWKDVHTYSTGEMRERRIIVAPGPAPAATVGEAQPTPQEQEA